MSHSSTRASKSSAQAGKPPSRLRTICQVALIVVTLLLVGTGGTLVYLYKSTPDGWTQTDAFFEKYQNADLLAMAEQLQNRVITSMGDAPQGTNIPTIDAANTSDINTSTGNGQQTLSNDPPQQANGAVRQQVIRLSINEINAWLAVKADSWLQFKGVEMPPEVSSPRIWVEGGHPVLGMQLTTEEVSRPISAKFELRVVDDGKLRIQLTDTRAGRLPIPHTAIASHLKKLSDKNDENPAIDGFNMLRQGIVFNPGEYVEKLDNNRLVGLTFDEQYLTITLEPAPQ